MFFLAEMIVPNHSQHIERVPFGNRQPSFSSKYELMPCVREIKGETFCCSGAKSAIQQIYVIKYNKDSYSHQFIFLQQHVLKKRHEFLCRLGILCKNTINQSKGEEPTNYTGRPSGLCPAPVSLSAHGSWIRLTRTPFF